METVRVCFCFCFAGAIVSGCCVYVFISFPFLSFLFEYNNFFLGIAQNVPSKRKEGEKNKFSEERSEKEKEIPFFFPFYPVSYSLVAAKANTFSAVKRKIQFRFQFKDAGCVQGCILTTL